MKTIQLLVILCLVTTVLSAQEKGMRVMYGKVTEEEARMQYYSKDSSAEAVLLYEEGIVTFEYDELGGIKMIYNYFGRFKLLKKAGLNLGIIKIPLYQGSYYEKELLRNVEGCTYNFENGKIIKSKLTDEGIFHEHVFDKRYQDKISMPDLRVGSVFEYRYTKETPLSVHDKPERWYFQRSIPTQWSEFDILIPVNLSYRIYKGGYLPFLSNLDGTLTPRLSDTEKGGAEYRLAVKDAPAFHEETFVTSKMDYISKIDFELTSLQLPNEPVKRFTETWDNLAKTLLKTDHYAETFERTRFLDPVIKDLKTMKDTLQCIQRAFDYVSKSLEWDHTVSVFSHTDANKVYENKKGSATEINLIQVSLLKAIGFNANPVILSTRGNGKINEQYPSLDQFNYTIACVTLNGKDLLMDATDAFTKPGMLPQRCLNGTGRLIKEGKDASRFVSLKPTEKEVRLEMLTAYLNTVSGEITGNTVLSKGGYEARKMRELVKEQGETGLLKSFQTKNADWNISNLKWEDKNNSSEPVKITFDFNLTEEITATTIYLNPMLSMKMKSNPFTEQNRIYPIDLTIASDDVYLATIKIPEGYAVDELPKPASILLHDNLGKFTYVVNVVEDEIRISSRITLNEYYFAPEEYEFLKNFYDLIVQKHAQQVVLKKK